VMVQKDICRVEENQVKKKFLNMKHSTKSGKEANNY